MAEPMATRTQPPAGPPVEQQQQSLLFKQGPDAAVEKARQQAASVFQSATQHPVVQTAVETAQQVTSKASELASNLAANAAPAVESAKGVMQEALNKAGQADLASVVQQVDPNKALLHRDYYTVFDRVYFLIHAAAFGLYLYQFAVLADPSLRTSPITRLAFFALTFSNLFSALTTMKSRSVFHILASVTLVANATLAWGATLYGLFWDSDVFRYRGKFALDALRAAPNIQAWVWVGIATLSMFKLLTLVLGGPYLRTKFLERDIILHILLTIQGLFLSSAVVNAEHERGYFIPKVVALSLSALNLTAFILFRNLKPLIMANAVLSAIVVCGEISVIPYYRNEVFAMPEPLRPYTFLVWLGLLSMWLFVFRYGHLLSTEFSHPNPEVRSKEHAAKGEYAHVPTKEKKVA
eukprot:jgi/Chlat1/8060/Chrsp73S07525